MNRNFKDYALAHQRRRGIADSHDFHHLDLFSRNRHHDSSDDRTAALRLRNISVGSVKSSKCGFNDLLNSTDSSKHDYDWLLTPPETPHSAEGNEFQKSVTAPRRSSAARSVSASKPSRLSTTTRVESNASSRPARSSSITRSSVSYSQNNNSYHPSIRSSTLILNTSSASVSSYIRPSSPITRSSSTTRSATPARTTPSRSSTPSKTLSAPTLLTDKPRPSSYGSRPSTPSSRPQISSHPSTPTRRTTTTSASRPSSPTPSRIRSQQPATHTGFPLDTPPNLRTTLPDRPVSAGRSRPVGNATIEAKTYVESQGGHANFSRRAPSPIVGRGRSVEPKGRSHAVHSNGHANEAQESRRSSYVPESPSRRNGRASTTTNVDMNGYGTTISKKSLDMTVKHMGTRDGSGSMRVRYPQSIQSTTSHVHAPQTIKSSASSGLNGRVFVSNNNGFIQHSENGKYYDNKKALENGRRREENGKLLFQRLGEVDMFESSRYDAILMKEDLKNTNWLFEADDKLDPSLIFEPLPEPFGSS